MSSATGQLAGEAERPQARIAALDALRGLAAFAIVVFHYVHFMPGGQRPYETRSTGSMPAGITRSRCFSFFPDTSSSRPTPIASHRGP